MGRTIASIIVCVVLALMVSVFSGTVSDAAAQTPDSYGLALEKAAPALAAALRQRGLGEGAKVGIARFRARNADVTCEPLSSLLAEGLRNSFLTFNNTFRLGFDVAASVDPRSVPVLGGGRWHRGANGEVVLTLVIGDAQSEALSILAMTDVAFDPDTLPKEARSCLLDFQDIEKEVTLSQPIKVREAPSSLGQEITTLRKGTKVWVAAKVSTPGTQDWFVVDLNTDRELPAGMRRQRGFAHGVMAASGEIADSPVLFGDRIAGALNLYRTHTAGGIRLPFAFSGVTAHTAGTGYDLVFADSRINLGDGPPLMLGSVGARITPIDGQRQNVVINVPNTATFDPEPGAAQAAKCMVSMSSQSWKGVWDNRLKGFTSFSVTLNGVRSACEQTVLYTLGRLKYEAMSEPSGDLRDEDAIIELTDYRRPKTEHIDAMSFASVKVRLKKTGFEAASRAAHVTSRGLPYFPVHLPFAALPLDVLALPDWPGNSRLLDGLNAEIDVTGLTGKLETGGFRFDNAEWHGTLGGQAIRDDRLKLALESMIRGSLALGEGGEIHQFSVKMDGTAPVSSMPNPMVGIIPFFKELELNVDDFTILYEQAGLSVSGRLAGDPAGPDGMGSFPGVPLQGTLSMRIDNAANLLTGLMQTEIARGDFTVEGIRSFLRSSTALTGLRPSRGDWSGTARIAFNPDRQPVINGQVGFIDFLQGLARAFGGTEKMTEWRYRYIVANQPVNMRNSAGMDSDVIATLQPGMFVEVGEADGEWTEVYVPNGSGSLAIGHVATRFLGDTPPAPRTDGVAPATSPLEPGTVFRDCTQCPEMVVVPSGSYQMGDPGTEGEGNARPAHKVTFAKPFAIGRFEVMRAEWAACLADAGCNGYWPEGMERNVGMNRPMSGIHWQDAKAFTTWLSRKTGMKYRLPSEAEWEYAARAGTTARYPWGDKADITKAHIRRTDDDPMPVGVYPPNAFGLYDMIGNVREQVDDCRHWSYDGAPSDGSIWINWGACYERGLRGGAWRDEDPAIFQRQWSYGMDRNPSAGFRVVREQ